MVTVSATLILPYLLPLPDGAYPTGGAEGPLHLKESYITGAAGSGAKYTIVSVTFQAENDLAPQRKLGVKKKQSERLLRQTNRLIRWYRSVSHQAAIVELTRAQASPIRFTTGADMEWAADVPFEYDANPPPPISLPVKVITSAVRKGLASAADPEVADLFLLDAEQARRDGRFREAVLFCWSTIDATFSRKYDKLVNQRLKGEWSDARDFFTGIDFGMRNKMSAALFLVAGRSLFREPDDLWKSLTDSYKKRNNIIHRGEVAEEADAELALEVAGHIVKFMKSLTATRARTNRQMKKKQE